MNRSHAFGSYPSGNGSQQLPFEPRSGARPGISHRSCQPKALLGGADAGCAGNLGRRNATKHTALTSHKNNVYYQYCMRHRTACDHETKCAHISELEYLLQRLHVSDCVSICQHVSAIVSMCQRMACDHDPHEATATESRHDPDIPQHTPTQPGGDRGCASKETG